VNCGVVSRDIDGVFAKTDDETGLTVRLRASNTESSGIIHAEPEPIFGSEHAGCAT
jgi:hypothetical protein